VIREFKTYSQQSVQNKLVSGPHWQESWHIQTYVVHKNIFASISFHKSCLVVCVGCILIYTPVLPGSNRGMQRTARSLSGRRYKNDKDQGKNLKEWTMHFRNECEQRAWGHVKECQEARNVGKPWPQTLLSLKSRILRAKNGPEMVAKGWISLWQGNGLRHLYILSWVLDWNGDRCVGSIGMSSATDIYHITSNIYIQKLEDRSAEENVDTVRSTEVLQGHFDNITSKKQTCFRNSKFANLRSNDVQNSWYLATSAHGAITIPGWHCISLPRSSRLLTPLDCACWCRVLAVY